MTFHGVMPDFFHTQWNEINLMTGESLQQCLQWTQNISHNWMKPAKTRENVIDMINRERLLDVMDQSAKVWVRQQSHTTSSITAELADKYILSMPTREDPWKWTSSGASQDWSKSNPGRVDYAKPPGRTMTAATMPTTTHTDKPPRPPAFDVIKGPRCFQCNEYGHIAKQYPTKVCLMAQAHQQDLERTQGTINGKRSKDLIIDSGCQMMQVHHKWLTPGYRRETPIQITCIHGDVRMHETTTVDLDVMGKTIRTQVVVNPNLTSDGIIGLDILTDREYKSSYLAQTRSKTKGKGRIKTRLSTTTYNESCESRESSPTPPSDTDDTDRDSTSTVNSNEEESATDSGLPKTHNINQQICPICQSGWTTS